MFDRRSKAAFIGAAIGIAYSIYSVAYWLGVVGTAATSSDVGESLGAGIATALVLPHVIVTVLATVFAIIGFFVRGKGLILTGAILYSVAAVLFLVYAIFLVPSIVLGFVGYSNQKKLNQQASSA